MAIGSITDEASLGRWLRAFVQRPGVLPPPKQDVTLIKAGVPNDEDFPNPPGNGTLALDSTVPKLYARVAGSWVAV